MNHADQKLEASHEPFYTHKGTEVIEFENCLKDCVLIKRSHRTVYRGAVFYSSLKA